MTAPSRSGTVAQQGKARLGGRVLSWLEAGQGEPLVLLHGIGSNARSWQPVMPDLGAGRRVIAWDAPGYGASDALGEARPDAVPYAEALAALLRALGISRAVVVGHSLGALMGAALAERHPDLVAGLVLADPASGSGCPPDGPWPDAIATRLRELVELGPERFAEARAPRLCAPGAPPDAVAAVRRSMAEIRISGYAQACSLLARGDLAASVAGLRVPGLVTCGALDAVVPPDKARRIADAWPGAGYVEIPGVGHAGYVENPAAYAAPILRFLEAMP